MKKFPALATLGLALTLVAGSLFAVSTSATAADSYVPQGNIGAETPGTPYPSGWFIGDPAPTVAPSSTDAGLVITGRAQLLYNGAQALDTLAAVTTGLSADVTGTYTFQIPVFFNPAGTDKLFTTLRPAAPGPITSTTQWVSSRSVTVDGRILDANVPMTAQDVEDIITAAKTAGFKPAVLAIGIYVGPGDTATVKAITLLGNTYHFTPEPVVPETPEEGGPGVTDPGTNNPVAVTGSADVPVAKKSRVSLTG